MAYVAIILCGYKYPRQHWDRTSFLCTFSVLLTNEFCVSAKQLILCLKNSRYFTANFKLAGNY
jgi:hypothetical protein